MNYYSDFVVSFGLMLVLIGAATAWLFKTSSALLIFKIALPVALIAIACHTPIAVSGLLGLPVNTTMGALPEQAQLIAFHPIDDEKRVDLWLLSGDVPRAYQIEMTKEMKRVLKAAQAEMQSGRPVFIRRKGKPSKGRPGNGDGNGNGEPGDGKAGKTASVADFNRQESSDYELVPGTALLPEKK